MKIRKKMSLIFTGVLLSGIVAVCYYRPGEKPFRDLQFLQTAAAGEKPFRDLQSAQIAAADVRLTPPDKTLRITDTEELAQYLKDLVIYGKDNSCHEYSGQAVCVTLTMADGTQTEIMEDHPFLVIDGTGYQTEYEPCEALNRYASSLLEEEDAPVLLKEPPALDVIIDEMSGITMKGSYSWQYKNPDGTMTGGVADAPHPLDCKKFLRRVDTAQKTAVLRFQQEPDAVSVCCWSDSHWSDTAAESEKAALHGYELALKPGGYIYEVHAEWNMEESVCGGWADYYFYVDWADASNDSDGI